MSLTMVVLIAIMCFAMMCCTVAIADGGEVKEPSTGISFPGTYKAKKFLDLAGVGVRVKQIGPIRAKVYAVGLYVDKVLTLKRLKSPKYISLADLANAPSFELDVVGGQSSEKTFELRMARSVGADTMVQALTDSILPRMGGNDGLALKQFENLLLDALKGEGAKVNTILSFESSPSKLSFKINGVKKGDIPSPTLSKAFIGVYLDKNGVSPSLRENVAKTVFGWNL